ncbi:type I toxin-antitoxin system toxin SymE [Chitinophaga polysaccharea]|uniref:Type I toxin-antitoxin system toxin SymE n=1 Tax=Chitinophaga polysaccharea TaxID=1293035 RepID=A0A561PN79_9BACT|nr:SymE family type I addiction module toxin [Chitinophaga polysaccharea]TWF39567.1 type I toxin-antitoxin system toxin SymE [Chitinophaga polysaccharea]
MQSKTARIHARGGERADGRKTVPWLNLSGIWLEKAGFDIGDGISISVAPNSITITVTEKIPKPPKRGYCFDSNEEL